jgi:hypothetical protein
VREFRLHGSVRGALSDGRPYRKQQAESREFLGQSRFIGNHPLGVAVSIRGAPWPARRT